MPWIVFAIALLAAIALPGFWVRHIMRKYSEPADRYRSRGTGGELARHLLDRFGLDDVRVETADGGDHYDPGARAVRLSPENRDGYSLTAVTVAAHEVGHALQDARGEVLFRQRQRLVGIAVRGERLGSFMLLAAPLIALVTRVPQTGFALLVLSVATMALGTLVHFVTLPVELDASFGKALPILREGRYLRDGDLPHARRILRAAAMTYVAGSLASLLNLGRWITVLRR